MLLSGIVSPAAAAPRYLGPNKCSSCHDHEPQKVWSEKDKHAKALAQLEDKNAAKYAAAIGLSDPYNLKGACVACHATVFNGDANAGVSCETCHGAGSDYVEPHQQKGSYAKAITQGMFDTRGNYPVWAKMCLDCHIMTDKKLVAAGHKSGADFEVGASSQKIVHWKPVYDFGKLSAAGKGVAPKPAGGGVTGAGPAAKPTTAPVAKPTSVPAAKPPAAATPAPKPPAVAPAPPTVARPTPTRSTLETQPTQGVAVTPPPTATRAPAAEAPQKKAPPLPERTSTPAPKGDVLIQIRVTPIPSLTPTSMAPAPETRIPVEARSPAPQPPPATRRPSRPHRPRVQRSPVPTVPAPTRTPTKLPAPQEPPRRPPH